MHDSKTATDAEAAAGGGISARDVTVSYRNGHTALRHASFEIPRGTVTALVGVPFFALILYRARPQT